MSVTVDIAEAVKDLLNAGVTAGTFAPFTFAAERTYDAPRDLESIQDLIVLVMASAEQQSAASRDRNNFLVTIQTAVCKRVDAAELANTEIDKLQDLVQNINDTCRHPLTTLGAGWQASRRSPIYDAEKLQTHGLFLSVTEHDYILTRRVP